MAGSSTLIPKRTARVVAVQFLYQMQITCAETFSNEDVNEFIETYVNDEIDIKFFKKLIADFQQLTNFEEIISNTLKDGKDISNSPPVEICIIKTALIEMIFEKTDIPVIINEYVEIAKDFVDIKSAKFINALLDKISKKIERRCQKTV